MQSKKFKAIITTYKSVIIVSFTKSKFELPAYTFEILDNVKNWKQSVSLSGSHIPRPHTFLYGYGMEPHMNYVERYNSKALEMNMVYITAIVFHV